MNKKIAKLLSIVIAIVLLIGIFSGCTQKQTGGEVNLTDSPKPSASSQPEEPPADVVKEDVTLTSFYGPPNVAIGSIIGNDPDKAPREIEFKKLFKGKYGYNINYEYIFCGQDEVHTKLQILASGGDLPDLFPAVHEWYPGGPSKAALDGVILNFMDREEKIPNIISLLDSTPMLAKSMRNDDGGLYCMGDIRTDPMSAIFFGPVIRKDLLEKAELPIPETMDEWYTALLAFKEQGIPTPLSGMTWFWHYCNAFAGAWDATGIPAPDGGTSLVIDDNDNVVYGCATPGYKEFLTTFNKWYKEGLLDLDGITSGDWGAYNTKLLTQKAAAGVHFLAELGMIDNDGRKEDPDFHLVAAQYPVLNKGEQPRMGQWDSMGLRNGSYVNAKSENIDACLDVIDLVYSEEGIMIANYGVLGKTYNMVDNKPEFTDYIVFDGETNVDGLTANQVQTLYCGGGSVILPDVWYMGNTKTQEEKNAIPLWDDVQRPAKELINISFTEEETEMAKKRVDLDTYVAEQYISFITGNRSLDEFDEYVNTLKTQFKMDEVVQVYQDAYTRYKNR